MSKTRVDLGTGIDLDADSTITASTTGAAITAKTAITASSAVTAISAYPTTGNSPEHDGGIAAIATSPAIAASLTGGAGAAIPTSGAVASIAADAFDGVVIEEEPEAGIQRAVAQLNASGTSGAVLAVRAVVAGSASLTVGAITARFTGLPDEVRLGSKGSEWKAKPCAVGAIKSIPPGSCLGFGDTTCPWGARAAAVGTVGACAHKAVIADRHEQP
ncbi:hypothetical protein [Cyanobium sp. LEGE 06113]|uniref:hypothetical protein n=1 Tax=Cyanobium sp. LEGE 06113 TaxID=1297573 RepID=UPI00188096A6|nr:hypothetical protein [Cyanobium sp. LEGE 06113]MBE9155168.1 hypothetical protein [Cyanobium sp. LEGE 06113]